MTNSVPTIDGTVSSHGNAVQIKSPRAVIPFDVTDDADTTVAIPVGELGLFPMRIYNYSGDTVVLTIKERSSMDADNATIYDADGIEYPTITIVDNGSRLLPPGLEWSEILIITGAAAANGLVLKCGR
jgi:hypothetical protein